jgi:hypothetical protein
MFPVQQIMGLARTVRIERMIYRGDQFHTIRKFLHIPQDNLIANNAFVKESQKFAAKILPKKKVERRKIKRSLVD